jgi:mannose-6-phosphate isomerase-like protein (cupin superfamily)
VNAGQGPRIVGPTGGRALDPVFVRLMLESGETGGGFSLLEHPIPPRTLVGPLHKHSREDEYSFVVEGRMGALLGDEVVEADAGDLVFKPRDQWHTFWNAGGAPCRVLEIISPGGFEGYFEELTEVITSPTFSPEKLGPVAERYGLEVDPMSIPRLCEEHDLDHPMLHMG